MSLNASDVLKPNAEKSYSLQSRNVRIEKLYYHIRSKVRTKHDYMYLPPLLMPDRYSGAALYEAAGRRPAVAWLSALPVMSNISPGANPPSARYQRPLGSQT